MDNRHPTKVPRIEHERDIWDRQAVIAERLAVVPDPATGERHVMLGHHPVGKVEWRGDEDGWTVLYADGDGYAESHNYVMAEPTDLDEADAHGIGWVADAIARGQLRPTKGDR